MSSLPRRIKVDWPAWSVPLFEPHRYKIPKGGRGSSKSWTVARALISMAAEHYERVLCAREIQKSIKDSVFKLLVDQIKLLGLTSRYRVSKTEIVCPSTGSEFLFGGLRTNADQIKSMGGLTKVWVEEADKVSKESWKILVPTVRRDGSEIWITYNPDLEEDPVNRFLKHPAAKVIEVNWRDNPWFPEELRKEMEYDYSVDPDSAAHVWGGQFRTRSKAEILGGKWVVDIVDPTGWLGPYFGADFGFATDPATLVKVWVSQDHTEIFVEAEAYGVGVSNNEMFQLYNKVPGAFLTVRVNGDVVPAPQQWPIMGDCSRPETINHLCGFGLNVLPCKKWAGSVEDGIAWLRGLKRIIVHPNCTHCQDECKNYKYKVDPVTGEVLPIIIDKHNHTIDPIRYALEPFISLTHDRVFEVDVRAGQPGITPELDEFDLEMSNW